MTYGDNSWVLLSLRSLREWLSMLLKPQDQLFWFPHKVKNGFLTGISGHNTSISCWSWLWSLTLNLILPLCTSGYMALRAPGFTMSQSCCLGKRCLQHGMPAWNELGLNPTQMQCSRWLHPALLPIPHCIPSLFNISSLRSTWQAATYS